LELQRKFVSIICIRFIRTVGINSVTGACLLLPVLARHKHSEITVTVIKRVAELRTFRLYRDLKE